MNDPRARIAPRRSAASCCARAGCRRRSSAPATTLLPRYGVAYAPAPLDCAASSAAGTGDRSRSASAWARRPPRSPQRSPIVDFLGVEVHLPGVGALLQLIDEQGLTNVRVIRHDAVEVVAHMIAPGVARRHPRLLSRSVAEEAPPQAPAAAGRRSCTRSQQRLGAGRLPARRDRLGRLRDEILARRERRAAARQHRRRRSRRARRSGRRPSSSSAASKLGHGVWDIVFERR